MSNNSNTCYKADGTQASDIPCGFPNLSTCCGDGWDCLSNGLCRQHGTIAYSQSTCTNPSYKNCLSFCNQSQFDGYTEVSRCESNGNSWCCAGAVGQDLNGGPNCCETNGTTSLEPYPFSAIGSPGQSAVTPTSISSSLTSTVPDLLSSTPTSVSSRIASTSTSLQSKSQTAAVPSTQISSTPSSQTSTDSHSPQPTNQADSSKSDIEIGIPVAIVVIILAVIAIFTFQDRKFKHRLLKLRDQMAGSSPGQDNARPEMQRFEERAVAELDLTRYELSHRHAPKHELLGNEIHELNHHGFPEHELAGDDSQR